ncbi:MAG: hypothetical protein GXO76_09975 [Calditrichaeota bacterium]|nr:hypothetical protein [Calditrichota bacterium]
MKKTIQIIIFSFLFIAGVSAPLFAQKEVMTYLKTGDFTGLKKDLPQLQKKYPNSTLIPYLKAILISNGKTALQSFKNLRKTYKNEKWLPAVLMRIAQYHYVQGYYISAKDEFRQVAAQYPKASLAPEALYQVALCWMAMAATDSARVVLEKVVERYYGSKIAELASRDLREISGGQSSPAKTPQSTTAYFTVQTGAFSSKDNATLQLQFFEQKGIHGVLSQKTVNGKTLYLVWIGKFTTQKDATAYGKKLQKKFKVSYRIVEHP